MAQVTANTGKVTVTGKFIPADSNLDYKIPGFKSAQDAVRHSAKIHHKLLSTEVVEVWEFMERSQAEKLKLDYLPLIGNK